MNLEEQETKHHGSDHAHRVLKLTGSSETQTMDKKERKKEKKDKKT